MDLAIPIWEKNMLFACHTIAHGTDLRRSPRLEDFKISNLRPVSCLAQGKTLRLENPMECKSKIDVCPEK